MVYGTKSCDVFSLAIPNCSSGNAFLPMLSHLCRVGRIHHHHCTKDNPPGHHRGSVRCAQTLSEPPTQHYSNRRLLATDQKPIRNNDKNGRRYGEVVDRPGISTKRNATNEEKSQTRHEGYSARRERRIKTTRENQAHKISLHDVSRPRQDAGKGHVEPASNKRKTS